MASLALALGACGSESASHYSDSRVSSRYRQVARRAVGCRHTDVLTSRPATRARRHSHAPSSVYRSHPRGFRQPSMCPWVGARKMQVATTTRRVPEGGSQSRAYPPALSADLRHNTCRREARPLSDSVDCNFTTPLLPMPIDIRACAGVAPASDGRPTVA